MGQTCVLQVVDIHVDGQLVPLLDAGVVTDRVRVCSPASHVCEHVPYAPQSATTHATGDVGVTGGVTPHCPRLHESSPSLKDEAPVHVGAGFPAAGVLTCRVRVNVPMPHVAEHEVHSLHAPIRQYAAPLYIHFGLFKSSYPFW